MRQRQFTPELMDEENLPEADLQTALRGLQRLNYFSRSSALLWPALRVEMKRSPKHPLRVLDIGSGAGDVAIALSKKAKRAGMALQVDGIDINPHTVAFAQQAAKTAEVACRFSVADALADELPGGYDVLMSSLFLHHLSDQQAVTLLQKMKQAAARLVLINDLRRCQTGYLLAVLATRILSDSAIVHVDGPRSVENAFTIQEARELAAQAGLDGAQVSRRIPFRFLLQWRRP